MLIEYVIYDILLYKITYICFYIVSIYSLCDLPFFIYGSITRISISQIVENYFLFTSMETEAEGFSDFPKAIVTNRAKTGLREGPYLGGPWNKRVTLSSSFMGMILQSRVLSAPLDETKHPNYLIR